MIREFAFGFANRHFFHESNKAKDWEGLTKDTFISLFSYDEDVITYFQENKTLAGYTGKIYMPQEYLLDVDGHDVPTARKKTVDLIDMLKLLKIPYNIYFSGRGFHVGIPGSAFKWKPSPDLHLKVKDELTKRNIFEYADSSVTDKTRIIRLNNTLNTKSKLWKIYLKEDELRNMEALQIQGLAKRTRDIEIPKLVCESVFDVMEREEKKKTIKYQAELGMNPDPMNYPCIVKMLEGTGYGNRHAVALRLAAWFRWRYPEHIVRLVMEDWRKRVSSDDHKFTTREMDRIVTDCYKGHNGAGYRYGCMDTIMDNYCKDTCTLYTAKKSQGLMTSHDMEANLMKFIEGDVKPIELGDLYGCDFPIYPGELVVLQAPPKTMKTMLLQNWVNALKRPTYFLEMEMSPRQIWQRFIQIEKGWTQQDIKAHYESEGVKLGDIFNWLYVDYKTCYPIELEKRISMLPVRPEIVVIDHMGLMQTKHRDLNMKMEEIAGTLTEIAIKHNVVVFAISEITKQAMNEGMNIASSRGSFRIAYNASKILSLSSQKDADGNIARVAIKTEANREAGSLNVILRNDNLRLKPINNINETIVRSK